MTLEELMIKVGVDLGGTEKEIQKASSSVDTLTAAFGSTAQGIETVKNKMSVLQAQYEQTQKKVKDLADEFNRSTKETGATSKETLELAEALDKAEREASGLKSELDKYEQELDDAQNKTNGFASKLKGSFLKIGGALGIAFGAAEIVKGIYQIGKAAVESYAEYEQLVGGVEKIFDEIDTGEIINDAQNAYKTLNLSANAYLETINSVGAAFASTMGDKAGYETAKRGMQAISDFASGTGKSVDELMAKYQAITRSAGTYQSIADQFSGILPATSADFLEQAQAAGFLSESYKTLTEVPIAEYQEAVTAMLEKGTADLGLAGNTAAETANTISGSIAAMKATWQNFLTGLADPDADLDQLTDDLTDTVIQVAKNLLPVIGRVAWSLLKALGTKLVEGYYMLNQLIYSKLVELFQFIGNWIMGKIGEVRNFFETLKNVIVGVFVALGVSIKQSFEQAAAFVRSIWEGIINFFGNVRSMFIEIGTNIILGIRDGILGAIGKLKEAASKVISSVKGFFTGKAGFDTHSPSKWGIEVGRYVGLGVALGIEDSATDAQQKAATFASKVMSATSKAFARQIKYQNLSIAEQIEGWVEIQKMFVAGSDEYLDAEEKIFDLKQKQRDDDLKAYKEYANKYLDTMEKIVDGISDARKKYADALASRTEEIAGSYGLFDEAKPVGQTSGTQLTRNLAGQVRNIERFYTELDNLAQRGVAEGLIEEIRGQGPDALDELLGLLSLSDKQLAEYNDLYERKQTFAAEQAKRELTGLYDETNIVVQDGLRAAWQLVSDGAPDIGLGFAEQLSEGILSGSDKIADAAIESVTGALDAAKEALANGNIGAVSFAQSGLGTASAGIINNVTGAAKAGMPITVNLVLPDGTKFAEWLFDPLVNYARANGTPILAT